MPRFGSLVVLVLVFACSGEPGKSTTASGTPITPADKSVSQTTEKSAGDASSKSPRLTLSTGQGKPRGSVPGPGDPPWFRTDLFAGATIKSSGRTPPDDQGLFSTQMLFGLADGATRDVCVETLTTALTAAIPTLAREEKDGRVTLRGKNDDYEVTVICGEAKGTMSAYVAYRWLKAPAAPATPATPTP